MQINEVISPLKKYLATVKIKGTQAKTVIYAETTTHARLMLEKQFGQSNVVSVSCTHIDETLIAQPLPTQEKHSEVINRLTSLITKNANKLRPTKNDLEIAIDRYKTNQKRVNRDFEEKQRLRSLRH